MSEVIRPGDIARQAWVMQLECQGCGQRADFVIQAGQCLPAIVHCWRCGKPHFVGQSIQGQDREERLTLEDLVRLGETGL